MGNHDVGRSMASSAEAFWAGNGDAPVSTEKALAVLDAAASRYIGADAEFDDELFGLTPLTRLIVVAFEATPEEIASLEHTNEENEDLWYGGPYQKFRDRYQFC